MKCAEFKEQVEAYALHDLDAVELAACTRHLADQEVHEGCEEALAQVVNTFDALANFPAAVRPSAGVWTAIENSLSARAPNVESRAAEAVARPSFRRRASKRPFWSLAAAVVAILVVSTAARWLHMGGPGREARHDVVALLGDPETQIFPLAKSGPNTGSLTARVLYHPGRREAVVVFHGVKASVGQDYELWVIRDGQKMGAGLLRPDPSGEAFAEVPAELLTGGRPDALAVTLEPAGGGTQPVGPIVLVGSPAKT